MQDGGVPIDFVITWVDGSDPDWIESRNRTLGIGEGIPADYRDWDLLRYLFRGIENFAPWVNRIHFVTCGHLPFWLNTDNPKLHIVKHEDFIPERFLPTFSSHTIELNLHRIEGLSETFVYFNDDTFLMKEIKPEFFFKDGLPRDCAVANPVVPKYYESISSLMINNASVINSHFKKNEVMGKNLFKWFNLRYGVLNLLNVLFLPWKAFPGFLELHLPTSFLKSSFVDVWSLEESILEKTCIHKVRNFKTDVNQWLIKEWQIASGCFYPRSTRAGARYLVDGEAEAKKAARAIRNQSYPMICVNDHCKTDESYRDAKDIVLRAFGEVFLSRSSFEKAD